MFTHNFTALTTVSKLCQRFIRLVKHKRDFPPPSYKTDLCLTLGLKTCTFQNSPPPFFVQQPPSGPWPPHSRSF